MSFGHDFFSYDSIFTSNAESAVFNATEFDIPNTTTNNNISVLVKWVESTKSYHFKGLPMADYEDTGEQDARLVQNSTIGDNGGVKARLDAGQGLIFDSLSPDDAGSTSEPIYGCMDEEATNYDPDATQSDSNCKYEENDETGEEEEEINPLFLVAGAVLLVLIMK